MKNRLFAVLVIALLSLSLLTACVTSNAQTMNPTNAFSETGNPPTVTPAATEAPTTTRLTEAEARDIALKHAGLTEDQVSRLRVEFGYDDGVPEYDVDFYHDGWEYDYEIHAETGVIRRSESERETVKQSKSVATEPPATEAPKETRLTEEQVLDIALKHAGLSKDQVSRLKVEFDYDDGVPEYDVDFYHDGWEYEYEIHAESGKIRTWDKDRDD